jgi:hypothetical protein
LATFLAAFFFFLAMELAPCHEHPDTHLTPDPPDALGRGAGDVSATCEGDYSSRVTPMRRVVEDGRKNCQGKKSDFFPAGAAARPAIQS